MRSAAVAAPSEPWLSAPLPFAAALPVAPVLAAPIAAPVVADAAAPLHDDLLSSIAALLESGEAWADHVAPATTSAEPASPAPPPQPPHSSGPLFVPDRPQRLSVAAPAGTAGAPLRPWNSPARVQLGFRDGSTAVLDPTCEQALALEELALLLTRRD